MILISSLKSQKVINFCFKRGLINISLLKLKEFRRKAKLTQKDVAKALNIGQPGYSMIESGQRLPNAEQIMQLSKIFKCTPNDLFGIQGSLAIAVDPLFEEFKELVEKMKK